MRNIIKIASVPYSRALFIQACLEAEGIYCFLTNLNQVQSNIGSGVNVMINERDKEDALSIIKSIMKKSSEQKDEIIERMKSVRRILVPVDFSDHSINAGKWAIALAHKLKAEVRLVHIYFNPVTTIPNFSEQYSFHLNIDRYINESMDNANYDLKRTIASMKRFAEEQKYLVKISGKIIGGLTSDAIIDEINDFKPALVVMGTKGKGDGSSALMGSVTRDLIESSKVPIFAIPQEATFRNLNDLHKVMYATDFEDTDFNSLGRLTTLLKPFDIEFHCVHIEEKASNKWDEAKLGGLANYVKETFGVADSKFHVILNENIVEGMIKYSNEYQIDIISITTHKRNFFSRLLKPSLAKGVVYNSDKPILIFHSM